MVGNNNIAPQHTSELSRQIALAGKGKMKLLDIVMPNGKRLAECTRDYIATVMAEMEPNMPCERW